MKDIKSTRRQIDRLEKLLIGKPAKRAANQSPPINNSLTLK